MTTFIDHFRTIPDFPQPGVQFLDIAPVLSNSDALHDLIENVVDAIHGIGPQTDIDLPDYLMGLDARGFIMAAAAANHTDVGCGMLMARKKGKLPGDVYTVDYGTEYSTATLELSQGLVKPGQSVIIIDDVLATGGTLIAAANLAEQAGLVVKGAIVVVEIPFLKGRDKWPYPLWALHSI